MVELPKFKTLSLTLSKNVLTLRFSRPERYNSLTPQAYRDWRDAIQFATHCEDAKVTVMTGEGKYYSSGQELSPSTVDSDPDFNLDKNMSVTKELITLLIHFPKILMAAVNGPAIGFAVTTLALCDVVYSVPHATFQTPFMQLAFCAEGCSSYIFPRIMGPARANEMLLLGRKFSAEEYERAGMLTRILPAENFMEQVLRIAEEAALLPPNAVLQTKELIRVIDREELDRVNDREMTLLKERFLSEESMEAIIKFMTERSNKKSKSSKL
ncbi:uncharacterized protein VTP21DRAFT_4831 [Calcarisporiella thermophila]|uniref:uncharacterized protein n=1 Tax=Calcarisporiella thermophila TaxID=911321 RepID=UPI0037430005